MTSSELRRMPSEQKERLYYDTPMKYPPVPINSETDNIKTVIDNYTKSEIPLDDVPALFKELSEITA